MASANDDVLQRIKAIQDSHEFSIIKLSEPISAIPIKSGEQRQSDISTDAVDSASPASLEADLSHYKVSEFSICPRLFVKSICDRNFSQNYDSPTLNKSQKRSFCAPS